VTISSYLLYLVGAIQLISVILSFAYLGDQRRVYEDAFSEVKDGDAAAAVTVGFLVGAALFGLLFGIGLVILAIFNNRGKNGSRITTWVVGGIFACCGGLGLISLFAGGSMNFGQTDPNMPTQAELQDMLRDALPSWYNALTIILGVLGVLALLGALILLALPPSNEFFRKPAAEWQPPAGAQPGYQAFPAYPPAAGPPPGVQTGQAPTAPSADPTAPPTAPPGPSGERPEDRPGGGA
jgi:hypothetical protein